MTINKIQILISPELNGLRIDSAVQKLLPEYSRGKIQSLIKSGYITIDGQTILPKKKVIVGDNLIIEIQEEEECKQFKPENIDIDIIYEDKDIFIVNKKPGMVVHPAAGNWDGTLLNAILFHYPDNEVLPRGGIVHRLDKDTSGLMVVARNEKAQLNLIKQLQNRAVKREYRAIVWGQIWSNGVVDQPIGRHPTNRVRMAVNNIHGKDSVTHYEVLERFGHHTYLRCNLETGRTHQIRVHMNYIKSPIVGDPVYGMKKIIPLKELSDVLKKEVFNFPRQALHSISLGLIHPSSNKSMKWDITLPDDIKKLLDIIRAEPNNSLKLSKKDNDNFAGEIIYTKNIEDN